MSLLGRPIPAWMLFQRGLTEYGLPDGADAPPARKTEESWDVEGV